MKAISLKQPWANLIAAGTKTIDEKAACIKLYPRAVSWFLRNLRPLKAPIPVKGQLGIFEVKL